MYLQNSRKGWEQSETQDVLEELQKLQQHLSQGASSASGPQLRKLSSSTRPVLFDEMRERSLEEGIPTAGGRGLLK